MRAHKQPMNKTDCCFTSAITPIVSERSRQGLDALVVSASSPFRIDRRFVENVLPAMRAEQREEQPA